MTCDYKYVWKINENYLENNNCLAKINVILQTINVYVTQTHTHTFELKHIYC